ncbi:unnamed protein product [Alopecurus aequalis]
MGKATVFLMALAVALAVVALADATPPGLRRSRFLAAKLPPPLSYDNCDDTPSICKKAGSPGKDCCLVKCTAADPQKKQCFKCVDTKTNVLNCGLCGKLCGYQEACCDGKCVNLHNDKKNCGACGNKCVKSKCGKGFCGYAG